MDFTPSPLPFVSPPSKGLLARNTRCPLSAKLSIMPSAFFFNSPSGLLTWVPYQFFYDPGPSNDHVQHVMCFQLWILEMTETHWRCKVHGSALIPCFSDHLIFASDFCQLPCRYFLEFSILSLLLPLHLVFSLLEAQESVSSEDCSDSMNSFLFLQYGLEVVCFLVSLSPRTMYIHRVVFHSTQWILWNLSMYPTSHRSASTFQSSSMFSSNITSKDASVQHVICWKMENVWSNFVNAFGFWVSRSDEFPCTYWIFKIIQVFLDFFCRDEFSRIFIQNCIFLPSLRTRRCALIVVYRVKFPCTWPSCSTGCFEYPRSFRRNWQWNKKWFFSRHVRLWVRRDDGKNCLTWTRNHSKLHHRTTMSLEVGLKKIRVILLEDCQEFYCTICDWENKNCHLFIGVNTTFALSLFVWISGASICSNSSMPATKMSPFQIPPACNAYPRNIPGKTFGPNWCRLDRSLAEIGWYSTIAPNGITRPSFRRNWTLHSRRTCRSMRDQVQRRLWLCHDHVLSFLFLHPLRHRFSAAGQAETLRATE